MQIEIQLSAVDDRILDFNYHHELSAALYQALSRNSATLGKELHDGAYRDRLKLFVLSPLSSDPKPEIRDSGLLFGKRVWMRFGSVVPEILFGMSEALLSQGRIEVRGKSFRIEKIDLVKAPAFQPSMVYRPFGQSGMIVCRYEKDGRIYSQFPDDPEKDIPTCAELLAENLRHKLFRLGEVRPDIQSNLFALSGLTAESLKTLPIGVEFLPLSPERAYRTGHYTIRGVPLRAFRAPVRITAPEAIHRIVWDVGIGSQNSQGFGMVCCGKQE